jgi:prepilin-type N-terminal cleavage/methylation domain-containing protein
MKSKNQPASGFTLLELLVSSALIGVVMLALLTATTTSLGLWNNTEERIAVDREGRMAVHLISQDLENLANIDSDDLAPLFDVTKNAAVPMQFLTLRPTDYQDDLADKGDICYVEYRFINNALLRAFVGSSQTFEALQANSLPKDSLNFEVVATNILQFRIWAWDERGEHAQGSAVRAVDFMIEVVDPKGMANFRQNPNLPLVGQQYFSSRAAIPAPAKR